MKNYFLRNWNVFLNVYVKVNIYCGEPNFSLFFCTCGMLDKMELIIGGISQSAMSRLKKKHHVNVDVRKRGFLFTKCIVCESPKDSICKLGKNNNEVLEYEAKLRKHILHQKSCRKLYHTWRTESMQSKDEFLCIIHDKMDHAKIALPRL
jgi:hypothetical protein